MKTPFDTIEGRIVDYDERTGELLVRAPYSDYYTLTKRQYKKVRVQLVDNRPLSDKQRRMCYALIGEIAEWSGTEKATLKELMKIEFLAENLQDTADTIFSLSDAPMSIVAAFQRFLVRFILDNDIPTRFPLLDYADDYGDYIYACLINRKCAICGRRADLHHIDRVGMGRNRNEIIHEGMEALPLCREHHGEVDTLGDREFYEKYHLHGGVPLDKTLCKIYKLKAK